MDGVCSIWCFSWIGTFADIKTAALLSDKELLSDVSLGFLLPLRFPLSEVGFHRCCGFVLGF